ncbi:hypothetical protein RH831_09380 [Halodesulfurarchaeum sp. HSR-GB]|uniref:hypothetical protein n=1 Tax=Halodesulfurarchaeum sp. HSR-GB TaxID=3074077 RepID=UPI00286766EA|nr:hypothetical protein [Halodesulfurarchaeum sp. HSR-GB]MDR5657390.1 hypothetical protein [Halodesulfurarchaeum sp. HSR-GB]
MTGAESQNNSLTVNEILVHASRNGLKNQQEDGAFPPGRNYTYDEPETPVRTTSQWLLTLSKVYKITDKQKYENAANAAIDYLLSDEVRPQGYTFHARRTEKKDQCNGLVGQAGPIRALTRAGMMFGRRDAIETAKEVFDLHPFNEELGLWERIEIDGTNLSFDRTLNHQLIFAAAARGLSSEFSTVDSNLRKFLNKLESNIEIHSDGLIKHYAHPPRIQSLREVLSTPQYYNLIVNEIAYTYYSFSSERRKKERGYQSVNLYALARLRQTYPDHEFWNSNVIEKAVKFAKSNRSELVDGKDVKHGSPLQGISIAKVLAEFEGEPMNSYTHLIEQDIAENPSQSEMVFDIDGIDSNTQTALIASLVDLPNIQLSP